MSKEEVYEERSPRIVVKRWKEGEKEDAWYHTKRGNYNIGFKEEVALPRTDKTEIHYSRVIGYVEVESHGHIQSGTKRQFDWLLSNIKENAEWFRMFSDRLNEKEREQVREVLKNDSN